MAESSPVQDQSEHFAHCVQVLGGVTAASRRLGIDERALRRFISGEKPFGIRLLQDTAQALRDLIAEATAAESRISGMAISSPPGSESA